MKNILEKINTHKKKIIIIGVLLIGGFIITTIPFTTEKKQDKIDKYISEYNYQKAITLNEKYFSKSNDEVEKSMYNLYTAGIALCKQTNSSSIDEAMKLLEESKPKIQSVKIQPKSYSGNYRDIVVTVQNTGTKSLNYIKINLYYLDDDGNVVKSEWMNDANEIKSNATQPITKMTKLDGWKKVTAEVVDWR